MYTRFSRQLVYGPTKESSGRGFQLLQVSSTDFGHATPCIDLCGLGVSVVKTHPQPHRYYDYRRFASSVCFAETKIGTGISSPRGEGVPPLYPEAVPASSGGLAVRRSTDTGRRMEGRISRHSPRIVIPAEAGIHFLGPVPCHGPWIPVGLGAAFGRNPGVAVEERTDQSGIRRPGQEVPLCGRAAGIYRLSPAA